LIIRPAYYVIVTNTTLAVMTAVEIYF